jgi:hypothetical protein
MNLDYSGVFREDPLHPATQPRRAVDAAGERDASVSPARVAGFLISAVHALRAQRHDENGFSGRTMFSQTLLPGLSAIGYFHVSQRLMVFQSIIRYEPA